MTNSELDVFWSEADLMLESENLDRSARFTVEYRQSPNLTKLAEIGMLRASAMSGDFICLWPISPDFNQKGWRIGIAVDDNGDCI